MAPRCSTTCRAVYRRTIPANRGLSNHSCVSLISCSNDLIRALLGSDNKIEIIGDPRSVECHRCESDRVSNSVISGEPRLLEATCFPRKVHFFVLANENRSATADEGDLSQHRQLSHKIKCEHCDGQGGWLRECGFVGSTRGVTESSDIGRWYSKGDPGRDEPGRTRAMQWGLPRLKAE